MRRCTTIFLDDGGVMNDNERRSAEWRRLIGEFLSPRLGGTPEAWGEANGVVFERQWRRFEAWQLQRIAAGEWGDFFGSAVERERSLREMCEHVGVMARMVMRASRWRAKRRSTSDRACGPPIRARSRRSARLSTSATG